MRGVVILPGTAAFGFVWAYSSPMVAFGLSAVIAAVSVMMLMRKN
jgi:hypothetical protein